MKILEDCLNMLEHNHTRPHTSLPFVRPCRLRRRQQARVLPMAAGPFVRVTTGQAFDAVAFDALPQHRQRGAQFVHRPLRQRRRVGRHRGAAAAAVVEVGGGGAPWWRHRGGSCGVSFFRSFLFLQRPLHLRLQTVPSFSVLLFAQAHRALLVQVPTALVHHLPFQGLHLVRKLVQTTVQFLVVFAQFRDPQSLLFQFGFVGLQHGQFFQFQFCLVLLPRGHHALHLLVVRGLKVVQGPLRLRRAVERGLQRHSRRRLKALVVLGQGFAAGGGNGF